MKKIFTPILLLASLSASAQYSHSDTIRLNSSNTQQATVWKETNSANNSDENIIANAWTAGGTGVTLRSLFKFNMPTLPPFAYLVSAKLTLYGNPTSVHSQLNSSYPGAGYGTTNEAVLQRVVSAWNPTTVTWTGLPTVTTNNQVMLQASTAQVQTYDLDITAMYKDMMQSPSTSYGFCLSLQNESTYRCLVFASNLHPNANLRPRLILNYMTPPAGIEGVAAAEGMSVYPNPAATTLHLGFRNSRSAKVQMQLTDVAGRTMISQAQEINPGADVEINVSALPRGLYFLKVTENDRPAVSRTISLQ